MELHKNKEGNRFLLIQFQSLMGHIDTLISSGTMRIHSLLLIWAFTISIFSSIFINRELAQIMITTIVIGVFLLILGIYILGIQISSNLKIVKYYRIINRIRITFKEISPEIENILNGPNGPLPFSDKIPKSIFRVFDPGLRIIQTLNSIAFMSIICAIMLIKYGFFTNIYFWFPSLIFIALIIQECIIRICDKGLKNKKIVRKSKTKI